MKMGEYQSRPCRCCVVFLLSAQMTWINLVEISFMSQRRINKEQEMADFSYLPCRYFHYCPNSVHLTLNDVHQRVGNAVCVMPVRPTVVLSIHLLTSTCIHDLFNS